jgi:dienelactone hydrolase
MKKIVPAASLSIALSLSVLSSADAQDARARGGETAQAGSAWPAVTDFAETGPFAIIHETNAGPDAAYDIVRPARLGEEGRKHPIVSWNNGTVYQIDRYQALLDHWASHGFVVIGGHTNSTAGGAVHRAAIDWLVAENAREGSVYFGMLDLAKIGAAGHSQGGGATITAGAGIPGPSGIVTTMPLMPISSFERAHLAQHAASMLIVSATEDERANRVADQALADVTTELVDAQFVGVHADAMHPGIHGATVAWLRYQLMGDLDAKAMFYPAGTCGLCGDSAWARLRHSNSPQ